MQNTRQDKQFKNYDSVKANHIKNQLGPPRRAKKKEANQ